MSKPIKADPRVTLKNIQHNERLSEETFCYSANVYFDGKRVGQVQNRGHGGCDEEHVDDADGWNAMVEYIDTLPIEEAKMGDVTFQIGPDVESVCTDIVANFLIAKDLKSLLRRRFVWQTADGEVRECKRPAGSTVEAMQEVMNENSPGGAKLLNAMPFAEALAIYDAI